MRVVEEREPLDDGTRVPSSHPNRRRRSEEPLVDREQAAIHQVRPEGGQEHAHLEVGEHHWDEEPKAVDERPRSAILDDLATAQGHAAGGDHEQGQRQSAGHDGVWAIRGDRDPKKDVCVKRKRDDVLDGEVLDRDSEGSARAFRDVPSKLQHPSP